MIEREKPVKQSVLARAEKNRLLAGAYSGKPEKPFDSSRNRHAATDCLVYVRQGARCDGLYPMSQKEFRESMCHFTWGCMECTALCTMRMFKRSFKRVYRGRRRIQLLKAQMMKPKNDRIIFGKFAITKTPYLKHIRFNDNSGGK